MRRYNNIIYREYNKIKINTSWLFIYIFMTLLVLFMALPLIYLVSSAFKPIEEWFLYPPRFFVKRPTLDNFRWLVWIFDSGDVPFTRYAFNSIFVTVVNVVLAVIISSIGAFALSKHKKNIPGANIIFTTVIIALTFPIIVAKIPSYIIISRLGIINTYWALIVTKIAVPMYFFLMKQFIDQFSDELLEAARIDGASEWKVFWKILMPAVKPGWCTLLFFTFVANWNDGATSLIYTYSQEMKALPAILNTLAGGMIVRTGVGLATSLLMTAPVIILFVVMQSRIMKTMAYSGIKA